MDKRDETLVLASSYHAGEFLEEDIWELAELVEEYRTKGKYVYNKDADYEHEWWCPQYVADELNNKIKEKHESTISNKGL